MSNIVNIIKLYLAKVVYLVLAETDPLGDMSFHL